MMVLLKKKGAQYGEACRPDDTDPPPPPHPPPTHLTATPHTTDECEYGNLSPTPHYKQGMKNKKKTRI